MEEVMHILSDQEVERLKLDKNFTISHLAFCLSTQKERNKILSDTLGEAVEWAKKVPSSPSEAEMINKWLQVLTEA